MSGFGFSPSLIVSDEDISFTDECCRKLSDAIRKVRRFPVDSSLWPLDFQRLLSKHPADLVSQVLSWYNIHIGQKDVPRVTSAKGFSGKFSTLVRAMYNSPAELEVSKDASRIAQELLYQQWPHGSDQHLSSVIERSLKAYSAFWRGVKDTQVDPALPDRLYAFLTFLLQSNKLSSPNRFIPVWFRTIHRQYANWEGWNGNLDPFVFSPSNPSFRRMGWGWSYEWAHSSRLWDKLMQQVKS